MRVICIDAHAWPSGLPPEITGTDLKEGVVYDVVDEQFLDGYNWFCISPFINFLYWDGCFAPLSTIDEMELLHNRQTELV